MGLAVLPARLQLELLEVENFLLGKPHDMMAYHEPWAKEIKESYKSKLNAGNVNDIIKNEVGMKFLRVLEDAAVFKRDERGQSALKRFITEINGEMGS
jgi:UDPglucose--hexose-1-phosphate uridylyltransferase